MEKLTLPLVEVQQDQDKTVFTFLDRERGEIRDVTFNSKKYNPDKNSWDRSEEQEAKVEEWAQTYFGVTYQELPNLQGKDIEKDVYCYDRFNSLWEVSMVAKFDEDMEGQLLFVTVSDVVEEVSGLKIRFEYEGETYQSNMGWGKYLEFTKEWFADPLKRAKVEAKFEDKFGIPFERKEELVGKDVTVEVKKAMGKYIYAEIKPFPKKKK